jgi:hypothetical protein
MVIGLGALASGSGAVFSSATFQNSVDSDADFRIVSQPGLTLRRGDAFSSGYSWAYGPNSDNEESADFIDAGSGIDFSTLKPSDLPVAWANEQEDGSLVVQLARQNNSSDVDFNQLIEVENTGQTDENVGISYAGGYAQIDDNESTAGWFVNGYSTTNPNEEITKADVQEIFTFQTSSDETQISPNSTSESDDANAYVTLTPGTTVQVDLKTTLNGEQTSVFASHSGGGDPFASNPQTGNLQLLEQITVGTEN